MALGWCINVSVLNQINNNLHWNQIKGKKNLLNRNNVAKSNPLVFSPQSCDLTASQSLTSGGLTRPRSISFVVMTMTCVFSWYTIFQKSLTVFCRHPWVAIKTLPCSTWRPSSCILYGWTAWMINYALQEVFCHEDESTVWYQSVEWSRK